MSAGYSEFKYWSPELGGYASRVSLWDDHGGEFFMLLACDNTRSYREARETAVEAIATAIAQGCEPGMVRLQ